MAPSKKSKSFRSFRQRNLKSFTLMELLIVIATIGLLISLILVAVRQARTRAFDKSIIANLSQVRKEATLIFNENNSYIAAGNTLCGSDSPPTLNENNSGHPGLGQIEQEVKKRNGNQNVLCYADANRYCTQSPLASSGRNFCVDYMGRAIEISTFECSTAGYDCVP